MERTCSSTFHGNPCGARRTRCELVAILAVAAVLQTLFISWMPGLQADGAVKALRGYEIAFRGAFIPTGVVHSGGALLEHLFALCFRLFGVSALSLMLPFAVMNILTVLLVYLFVRREYDDVTGLTCALVTAVSPWFVVYMRVPWEPSTIPFISMLSLWLIGTGNPVLLLCAGVVLGLGSYNYQYFVCLPITLLVLWALSRGGGRLSRRGAVALIAGGLLGYAPKILCWFAYGAGPETHLFHTPTEMLGKAIACVPYFPRIIDGAIIFVRTTGRNALWVAPLNSVLLAISVPLLLLRGRRVDRALPVALLVFFILVVAVRNPSSIRHFTFMLMTASLIIGLGIDLVRRACPQAGAALLRLFVGVNIFYLAANFFVEFHRTGGGLSMFRAGNFVEVSHHHVRTDLLYESLDPAVSILVVPDPHIADNLKFYDLGKNRFTVLDRIRPEDPGFYLIEYAPGAVLNEAAFRNYAITRERPELKNFSIRRFMREGGRT